MPLDIRLSSSLTPSRHVSPPLIYVLLWKCSCLGLLLSQGCVCCCCDRWRSVFWQIFKPADSQCKLQEQFNTQFPILLNKTGKTTVADRYDGGRLNNLLITFIKITIVTIVSAVRALIFRTVCPAAFALQILAVLAQMMWNIEVFKVIRLMVFASVSNKLAEKISYICIDCGTEIIGTIISETSDIIRGSISNSIPTASEHINNTLNSMQGL